MRVHEALHIETVGLISGQTLPEHVSLLVSIFSNKERSFEYRYPVLSRGTLRVRAVRVDHGL
jgi:hypothetical protein